MDREVVVASQRSRLFDAMAGAVAEKGFAAATTVADVIGRAGISRRPSCVEKGVACGTPFSTHPG